jgi:Mg/Co/Ni transporter MgtE
MILSHDLLTNRKTRHTFENLPRTTHIIDVGCGIRPCPAFSAKDHICIEPHDEYVEVLKQWKPDHARPVVIQAKAQELATFPREDVTVFMLDVIEHMPREDGEAMIRLLEEFEHAVIFTPLGWYEQDGQNPDAWGYNGGYWQKHRSAWQPEDFSGWDVKVWTKWHPKNSVGAILAVR